MIGLDLGFNWLKLSFGIKGSLMISIDVGLLYLCPFPAFFGAYLMNPMRALSVRVVSVSTFFNKKHQKNPNTYQIKDAAIEPNKAAILAFKLLVQQLAAKSKFGEYLAGVEDTETYIDQVVSYVCACGYDITIFLVKKTVLFCFCRCFV